MKYEYIEITKLERKNKNAKTDVFVVKNIKSKFTIGIIRWNPGWRQYCFFPSDETVFSKGCLNDICDFIEKIMNERKK